VRCAGFCLLFFVLTVQDISASHPKLTDAELDGLRGAVKSVTTNVERFEGRDPDAPNHLVITYPVWCEVCEYDEEGNSIKRGQVVEGRFVGGTTRYLRNEDGTIREKRLRDENGQPFQNVMLGPFGKTEEEDYQNGRLQWRQTFRYDKNGNLIEWLTFDPRGNQTASTTASYDEQGNVTEQFDRGPNNSFRLHFTQNYNLETDVWTFISYNENGTVRVTRTTNDNRITSYWEQPGARHEYGSGVYFNTAPKERECEDHSPDGKVWHQSEKFIDERRHDPLRVELRDETRVVQMAADYEYEFDSQGNWTKRLVWIWRSASGERKLHEVDMRTLTYWK